MGVGVASVASVLAQPVTASPRASVRTQADCVLFMKDLIVSSVQWMVWAGNAFGPLFRAARFVEMRVETRCPSGFALLPEGQKCSFASAEPGVVRKALDYCAVASASSAWALDASATAVGRVSGARNGQCSFGISSSDTVSSRSPVPVMSS